ncbi:MAG TPA: phytanoyl-CoA dioxygenase family protein [Caulobacteraceae bacterium]|jgi:hypothetical protein
MRNFANPLPGVPIVESPFFEEILGGGRHDEETYRIASDLRDRGFAVFEFPDPEFDRLSAEIRTELNGAFNWEAWRSGDLPGLRIQDAWRFNANVRRLATNEAVRRLISILYGKEAFPFQSLSFPVGTQQHYHTDSIHFSSMPERFMCGVWVALEDIGPDQGPLIYYPGSHKWPIYRNEHIGHAHVGSMQTTQEVYEPIWRRLVDVNGISPERFTARAGQALIWAANLLHGGDVHIDKSLTRWSQVTHYYFDDCSYYTPLCSDEPFGSIQFRSPPNILTGETVRNHYLGRDVPADFIASTSPFEVARRLGSNLLPADFDPAAYLQANPDVAASGQDAREHYLAYGMAERRRIRP